MSDLSNLSPFDFFRQETSNQDAVIRTDAMKKVGIVAALMGPEKARTDMLAYLQTKMDDLDQVLLALAERLEKFLPLVGGPDYAHLLIPLFESLCDIEEVTVRDAAAHSISKILKQLGSQSNKNQIISYFEFFKRISNEESGELFYSRVSSCHIVPELYALLNDSDKSILREIYSRLCKDELPIVRRAAAGSFLGLAALVDSDLLSSEILTIYKTLMNDESQSIQVIAVEVLARFSSLLKRSGAVSAISNDFLPYLKALTDDNSWRIRSALTKGYGAFAVCFSVQEVTAEVFPGLIHLVLDPEPEVRTNAVTEIFPFLEIIGATNFVSELCPVAVQLIEDPVQNVRKLLTDLCIDVTAKINGNNNNANDNNIGQMMELILKLINDEDPMVKLRVIKKMPIIAQEIPTLCHRLTEIFKSLFTNNNWRVRKALVEGMPSIVQFMGQEYFVDNNFLALTLSLVKDGFDEVRLAACVSCANIAALTNIVDINWIYDRIFLTTFRNVSQEAYLTRLSMISALQGFLALETVTDKFQADVVSQILQLTSDIVPNIRLRAAQALHSIMMGSNHHSNGSNRLGIMKDQISAALNDLQNDKDKDVRYFSSHPK